MGFSLLMLCCVFVQYATADTYKAAVSDTGLLSSAYEAGRKNVDILVMADDVTDPQDYEETVKHLSKAAKQAGLYLVAHLKEKTRCQNKKEVIRSNLVFDRHGDIVAVYRKPEDSFANCTFATGPVTFKTDFGVTFGLMMEDDLVLNEGQNDLKNFVVTGAWGSAIPYLSAHQFSASWAFSHNANLVSVSGIFAGKAGSRTSAEKLMVAELSQNFDENVATPPVINAADIKSYPSEDLSQYIIKPLDAAAGAKGYKESVCHGSFCCEFDLKTRSKGAEDGVSYGLAAFDGVMHFGGGRYIGAQTCALFACAGLYKRSCNFGVSNNNTNIVFEKMSISANYTNENRANYPVILSNQNLAPDQFKYVIRTVDKVKAVKMTVTAVDGLLSFGIFGRVFERDCETYLAKEDTVDLYNILPMEDLHEFFDYVWIRVRILMFVVSIYVLEML